MAVYEDVPLADLGHVLSDYASCWRTLVFAGVVINEGNDFVPAAMQVWVSDDSREQTEVRGYPELPDRLAMLKISRRPAAGVPIIGRILTRESLRLDKIVISFQHFQFARAAFLGSNAYDYLYPEELHQHVGSWPKLFLEGGFESRAWLEK